MSVFLSCQVCQQNFSMKGPAPFLLPCLHAVCETCVTSAAGGVISCSPCQRDVNLTETRLQKDVVREREILHQTVQRNPELVLCTHEEDGNQAVCWCKECDEFLCEHCQMVHNSFKITKQHNIHDVETMELGYLKEYRYCTFHPKLIADTWDKDCCILTCGKCRRGDHAGHDVADEEEAADTARNEITKLGKDIMPTIDQHRAQQAAAEKDIKSLDDKNSTLDGKISFTFDSFKVQLDQREKELKIALQNHKGKIRDNLNTRKTTSETGYQRCLTTSDYFNKTLKYSYMHEILELKQFLEDKFQDCKSSAPSEDYKSPPLPVFNTDGLDRIKSTLAHFGTIATEDTVLTNQMQDNGTQTEEDVVQELEGLKQELKLVKTSQEELIRQKEETARVNFKENEKMKKELKRVKTSRGSLVREKEETERVNFKEKEKMKKELRELKAVQQKIIQQEQEVERFTGLYRLRTQALEHSFLLNCTDVKFSKKKYNAERVHINTEGELINKSQTYPPHSDQRLKRYWGTSSTVPLPQCGSPQYFEVKSRVGIENPLTETLLLLEIGLAREEEQDQTYYTGGQSQSYCLNVAHCTTHSSICRNVWRHGNHLTCLSDTLENTPGSSVTLHYGVVYDSATSRIAFLDVKNDKVIWKIEDVDSSVALWPMFGVYNPSWANVSMSLVVGSDIDMTKKKKELILDCLS